MNEPISRRTLLAAPGILHAQSRPERLRMAVVGTGNRGSFLLKHLLRVQGVEVVAVCDILPERASAAAGMVSQAGGKAREWSDFRKMLDGQKEIDAVVLATPDWTHKDFDIAILEQGKHLYAEKPLALTKEDGEAVVRAARQSKQIFQVGFQLRHDANRSAAMRFIHQGGIGQVLMCHGMRHGGDLPRDIPWYFDRNLCGDIVVDQGIHILDLFTWAIGSKPRRIYGTGGTDLFIDVPPGRTVMDNYSLVIEYANGARVNFSHHYFDPPGFTGIQERVFGSLGSVDLIRAEFHAREKRGAQKLEVPDAGEDSTYLSLRAFAENIREGRKPLNDAESAYVSTLLPILATQSIRERRIVEWPPA